MTALRRRLRRLRFALVAAVAGSIIVVAVVVGLARLALPWLAHNPERVADWLSARLGRSVAVGHVSGLWTRAGPRLVIDDLVIGRGPAGEAPLELARAELALNLYAPFQRNRAWNEFRLVGLDLALERGDNGIWQIVGIDTSGSGSGSMGALGAVVLVDLELAVRDKSRGIDLAFAVPELRVVNLGDTTRVLGRIGLAGSTSPLFSLVADIDLPAKAGRGWLGGRDLDLAEVAAGHSVRGLEVPAGRGDIELWGEWSAGRVDDVRARFDLRETTLAAVTTVALDDALAVAPRVLFERLAFLARWQRNGEDWTLDVADGAVTRRGVANEGARLRVERSGAGDRHYRVHASGIELEPLGSLAMLAPDVPPRVRAWLYEANPQGRVEAAGLDWRTANDFSIDLALARFAAQDARAIPGIDALDARLRGDAAALLLEIPQQATTIDFPQVFRAPFAWTRFGGDIVAMRDGESWRVQTAQLAIEAVDYAIDLRGGVVFEGDGSKPVLDLHAFVPGAEVIAAKRFWPIPPMSARTVEWLDRALTGGRVASGRAMFRGDLDDWPFREPRGRFEARADLAGLKLDYLPDWPGGEELDLVARFINRGMHAEVTGGRSQAIVVDAVEATIADFGEAILDLRIEGHGTGAAMLDYLRASPVGKSHAKQLDGLVIGGQGATTIDLVVPLKDNAALSLDGTVALRNADLRQSTWDIAFAGATGDVKFTRGGVVAPELAVIHEGRPARLGIAIGAAAADPANAFEASLHAVLPVASVFARASQLAPAFASFPGEAPWAITLAIGNSEGDAPSPARLRIDSTLEGIGIDLPAPLGKPAATAMPFSLALDIPPVGAPFEAMLGDVVRVRGRLPGVVEPLAARLDFGAGGDGPVPAAGVVVGGRVAAFDLGGWISLLGTGSQSGTSLVGLDLEVGDLLLGGRHFPATRFAVMPAAKATTIRFSGASIEGEVHLPATDLARAGITAQLQRLHWPEPVPGEVEAPGVLSGVAPSSIPPLHLWVGELRMGSANLGEARFESWPTAEGMHIDRLETESPDIGMRASGSWNGSATDNRSHLDIDMTSQNLGGMLDALGFAGFIDGGQTLAHIDATWPGAPGAFALANVTGTLEISVDKGRILDVDPGAGGRLFGLLSLREIPRRLSLDFSDLFKSGMTFTAINGTFELRDGNAYTEDLTISSPAAEIGISGRTGLRDKDYDQQMVVTPRAGVTLPVVGALAGGPVGAAAGLVMQGLIGKQINQAARSRYQVEGSWEKPQIRLLGRDKPGAAAKPQPEPVQPPVGQPAPDAAPEPESGPGPDPDPAPPTPPEPAID